MCIRDRRWSATEAAGLPLGSALSGLSDDSASVVASRVDHIRDLLQHGSIDIQVGFNGFTAVEVAFINVGRESGNLDGALGCLADLFEADYRTVLRARGKMTYPLMVGLCACWIPTLPLAFLVGPWFWLINGALLSGAVFWLGGAFLWRYFVRLRSSPRVAQVRFFWALATSLEAGVLVDEAIALSAEATSPSNLSATLRHVSPQGRPIAEVLQQTGLFDEAALNMVRTGELAGRLPDALRQAAGYLESGVL